VQLDADRGGVEGHQAERVRARLVADGYRRQLRLYILPHLGHVPLRSLEAAATFASLMDEAEKWLYAANEGARPLIRAVAGSFHRSPQCNSRRMR
jgi:hypothetical protein